MLLPLAQIVLAFTATGEPVRFGAPVPVRVLDAGLSLRGEGALQWRPLPLAHQGELCWVEIAVAGGRGRVQIALGGGGPAATGEAAVVGTELAVDGGMRTTWRWRDGTVDERQRAVYDLDTEVDGERYAAGEARTVESPGLAQRAVAALTLPRRLWEDVGLLPRDEGLAAPVRTHLQRVGRALVELPGLRGAGDHARAGDVVTNLEFDTAYALLRLAIAMGDDELLLRARRAAFHLVDRDLDQRSGLPFAHGAGHRQGVPEPGHVWLQGLCWSGAVFAEPLLLDAAQQIAKALAATPPMGEGRAERARDYAWPLRELEAWLTFRDDPVVAAAADRLAAAIAARFDERARTFRFGEGEGEGHGAGYFERGWLTGGVVVPALRAHLQRRPLPELQRMVDLATAALLDRIGTGRDGLPTHWRVLPGSTFAEHRAEHDPKAFLLLEALDRRDQRRLLGKAHVLRALLETPPLGDPDLPTAFAMVARCTIVYR